MIRLYQRALSPFWAPTCRFYPSCSAYASAVIQEHGLWCGGGRALRRLARCSPLGGGGLDLP
ncbi:MAG: membrane protein insertion efficiency factor YidD [Myxococcales bacterium]|nr:membrane protein insertion efficiency factor YidD [Myxococcales bacterium]